MSNVEGRQIGFIGLGAMGFSMARNLATKLPPDCCIHVFDVAQATVDQLSDEHPKRVVPCSSAREVADKSVSGHSSLVDIVRLFSLLHFAADIDPS